ncbi:MAG: hypothetical protein E6538_10815, partial [Paeniclostridium sordellii]|nr:hypothetical protein [Paeniclostridium sordellii]
APQNIEVLNIELEETKREYYEIITSLQKVKNNLIEIRNQKVDLELNIKEIEQVQKKEDKKWNKKSSEEGYVDIDLTTKILKSNELEELIIMKDELEELIISCNRKLTKKELEYKALLDKLHRYEEKLNINNSYISDILEHKGYLKAKDDLVIELGSIETKIEKFENELSYYNSIIRKYAARKSNANKEYESLMIESKKYFGLEEIADEKLKKVSNYFKADGSNLPIGTIIWHFNLLKVKDKFNKNSIKFPLLLDSPNNAELDEDKVLALFGYIFKNNVENTQLIVSTLAFNKDYYSDIKFDNIIKLDNDKYKLLNRTDYDKYKHILELILAN